ncbi:MAG TPA: carboxypeptidase-like regulatory domain-containing protein [Mariniphaga sp.]|nr:carboxypeptidase-like regulatory domain-containing protein [Mariniphaga sp.]
MRAFFISLLFCSVICHPFQGQAQRFTVSGTIINKSTGDANKHAAIVETISKTGTISNENGYFRLMLKSGNKIIEISSPGFYKVTSEFELSADTTLHVELVPLSEPAISNQRDTSIPPDSVTIAGMKKITRKKAAR